MRVGETVIFNKRDWGTISYGSKFTILEVKNFWCKKRKKKHFKIFDGDTETFVRSKNFTTLQELRKDKLQKINESR